MHKTTLLTRKELSCSLHLNNSLSRAFLLLLFILASTIIPASPASADGSEYVPGEILVGFSGNATPTGITAFQKAHDLVLIKAFTPLNLYHYSFPENVTVDEARKSLANDPIVKYVEPNYISEPQFLPSDPEFGEQWSLDNTGQTVNGVTGPADIDIDWPEAKDIFTGTVDVIVAIVDTGISLDHPEFDTTNLWRNASEMVSFPDSIDNDGNGYVDDLFGWNFADNEPTPLDENGHGTSVASIIGAITNNPEYGAGIAANIRIMALRVGDDLGNIPDSAFIDAALYAADNGARIINCSTGNSSPSIAVFDLISFLDTQGILFVAAAGNGGTDSLGDNNDLTPHYPSSYNNPNIISVAAQDRTGGLAYFSNYGVTRVDLAAPGTDIFGADVTRSTTFFEGFETGAAGWTQGHLAPDLSPNDWTLYQDSFGRTWYTDSDSSGTPVDYDPAANSWLESPTIVTGSKSTQLQYRIHSELELLFDLMVVEVTDDNGVTWNVEDTVTWLSFSDCPSCSLDAGTLRSVDLSNYDNQSINIRFRLVSNGTNQFDGVYIDDFLITNVTTFSDDGTQSKYNNGTSFSAPMVSGVAALIMSQHPDLTHLEVRELIINNVEPVSSLSGRVATGGQLNAFMALDAAKSLPPPTSPVDLSGTLKTAEGLDICAMVLASGQFMFSCDPNGVFSLTGLPRETDGTVKRQIYADGFLPKIDTLTGSSADEAVVMTPSGNCPSYNTPSTPGVNPGSAGTWIDISGNVLVQDTETPICAMVLANGQHMFSCDGAGSYALRIPLDGNGQFKLQVFADGFAPTIQNFDESGTNNVVRMARAAECLAP